MVDIKYRFTCGDSYLSEIIKKCQYIMTRIIWKFPMMIQISGKSTNFGSKMLVSSENN